MEEEEAHNLYQHFQKTDAAAKQKQGLGFGSSPAPPHLVDSCKKPAGWEAPYKLSDKFQQAPEAATSKRSRSSHSHRHSPEKRQRAHSSSSPDRSLHHSRDKAFCDRQSDKGQGSTRHSSRQKHREELRHSSSTKRHSESPDGHDHRISHHKTRDSKSPDNSHRRSRHTSKHTDSKRDSNKHSRRQQEPSYSRHERHRSHHTDHRSREEGHQQRHSSRNRPGDDQTNRALKAPDYAKLIVGYKYMSDANRLKAVTAYNLSKTSAKDVHSQDGKPWTRFVFNSEALLEEEGATPDGPAEEGKGSAGLGAFDFRPHRSRQIGKPAEDAHEAAIFGAPAAFSDVQPVPHSQIAASGSDSDERPQIVELEQQPAQPPAMVTADADSAQLVDPAPSTTNASKMSWHERALLKRQQQMTS